VSECSALTRLNANQVQTLQLIKMKPKKVSGFEPATISSLVYPLAIACLPKLSRVCISIIQSINHVRSLANKLAVESFQIRSIRSNESILKIIT